MNRYLLASFSLIFSLLAASTHAASVQGVVISTEGNAIAGATVRAYAFESSEARPARVLSAEPERKPVAEVSTDSKGKFSIDIGKLPAAQVTITAAGFAPGGTRAAGGDDVGAMALLAAPSVRGTITAAGKPVAGAWVSLSGLDVTAEIRTDDKGQYSAADPAKWARAITISHPDFAPLVKVRQGRATLGADYALTPGVTVSGKVVGLDGKSPIAGATIMIDSRPYGTTGDDGAFVAAHVPADWRAITARSGDLIAVANSPAKQVSLRLRRGAVITGVARDGASGRELPGASITLRESGNRFAPGGGADTVIADDKGRFRIGPLPPSVYSLAADFPGYLPMNDEVSLKAGDSADRTLNMTRGATIEGYVRDDDKAAVPGTIVKMAFDPRSGRQFFSEVSGWSAPDGRFILRPFEAAPSIELTATKKGLPTTRAPGISLSAGERKRDVVITIPRGVAVPIRVVDKDGNPIAGATISANEVDEGSVNARMQMFFRGLEEPDLPATAKDGTVELRLKAGKYDLTAHAPGFARNQARSVEVAERMAPVEIVLSPGVEIRGRVVTSKGAPVEGATVNVAGSGLSMTGAPTTGPDGSFVVADLEPGQVMLVVVKATDFIRVQRMVEAPSSDLVIETPAGGRISGRVIDKETKRPIADFTAGVSGERGGGGMRMMGPPILKPFHSDDGTFVLENVPVGRQTVVAYAPGYVRTEVPAVEVSDEKNVDDLEIALDTGVRVVGRVTGPDGSPVAGVQVSARTEGQRQSFAFGGGTQTDASGDYTIEAVEAGEKVVSFSKDGYVSEQKNTKLSGKEVRVDARLSRGTEVSGVVISEAGVPIAEAMVSARTAAQGANWNEVRTDSGGNFRFAGLAPGRYSFHAAKSGYPDKTVSDIDIATTPNVRIVMEAGGVVYGRVTGFRPEDAKNISVQAGSGSNYSEARIDSAGNYRIEGSPVGTVSVGASMQSMGTYSSTAEKRVEVVAGTPVQVDLVFGEGSTVRGTVTRDGKAVPGARVMLRPKDRRISSMASAMSLNDGTYSATGLEDGEYDLSVVDMQTFASFSTTCVVSGSSTCDLDMQGSPLRGTVADSSTGEPIAGASISVVQPAGTRFTSGGTSDTRGTFVLESLAPGTYQVRAEKKGYGQQVLDVVVSDGPPQDLNFRLSKSDGLRVRLFDARDGRDISGQVAAIDSAGRLAAETFGGGGDGASLALSPGVYRLVISATGFAPQNVRINVPSAEIRVGLTPGGKLIVRSSSSKSESARLLLPSGEAYLRGRWDPTGTLVLQPGATTYDTVAAGTYTLVVLGDDGNAGVTKQVTVVEGQTTEVAF